MTTSGDRAASVPPAPPGTRDPTGSAGPRTAADPDGATALAVPTQRYAVEVGDARSDGNPAAGRPEQARPGVGNPRSAGAAGAGSAGASPYRVEVVTRRTDGEPVPGVVITLLDVAGRQAARSVAAGDGRYLLQPEKRGHYVLVASVPGYHPKAATVEVREDGPATVALTLRGECGLFGRVRRVGGGSVSNASVTLTDGEGEVVATTTSSAEGDYSLDELLPGSYTMTASAPAYRPAARVVEVTDAGRVRQDMELVGGARVSGRIHIRSAGRPLPGARVSLVDPDGALVAVAVTGADGSYTFSDVAEGRYTVVATSYPPAASSLRVTAGQDAQRDLELGFD